MLFEVKPGDPTTYIGVAALARRRWRWRRSFVPAWPRTKGRSAGCAAGKSSPWGLPGRGPVTKFSLRYTSLSTRLPEAENLAKPSETEAPQPGARQRGRNPQSNSRLDIRNKP